MGEPPWLLDDFTLRIVEVIADRSMQQILQTPGFVFAWQESAGVMYMGDPADHAPRIFRTDRSVAGVGAVKRQFEQFLQTAESWPEAASIRESFAKRVILTKVALHQLEVAANTDPITTRCFLCRG
jgi:hypothetical protein